MAKFIPDGEVVLYHNSLTKFFTSSTGATVAGNLALTGGEITSTAGIIIDSTTSNADIVFKGNDGGSVITALTLDMSAGGTGVFNNGVQAASYFWGSKSDNQVFLYAGANFEIRLTHVHNTGFLLGNFGTGTPAVELRFVDANEAIGSDGTNLLLTSGGTEFKFPTADGTNGQVLQTDSNGTLSFADVSGGSAANQFPNCTVSPLPGSEGNFDLAKQYDQTGSAETPFEAIATDAFGVSLGEIYTMMDPVGSSITTDLGAFS